MPSPRTRSSRTPTKRSTRTRASVTPASQPIARGCEECDHIPLGVNRMFIAMSAIAFILALTVLAAVMRMQSQGFVIQAYRGVDNVAQR